MSKHVLKCAAAAAVSLALGTGAASAVTGTVNITGNLQLTSITGVDFLPAGGGTGSFLIGSGTGSFAGLPGTTGTIMDLVDPIGLPIANFMTFAALPAVSFDLTVIFPGTFGAASCGAAPAVGQTCSPVGSEFEFVNTAGGSTVSFSVGGVAHNPGDPDADFLGVYTAQFTVPYQTVLANLASGSPSPITTHSGSFNVTFIPEPLVWSLMILAFAVLGYRLRARARTPA